MSAKRFGAKERRAFLNDLRRMLDWRSAETRRVAVARYDKEFAEWQRSRTKTPEEMFAMLREELDRAEKKNNQERLNL